LLDAIDAVIVADGDPSQLERRIVDAIAAEHPGSIITLQSGASADGNLGLGEFVGLAARIRQLLAKAAPLGPQHVNSPDSSPGAGLDVSELDGRVESFVTSFRDAASSLSAAVQNLDAAAGSDPATLQSALDEVRSALLALAGHGIVPAYPQPLSTDIQEAAVAILAQASAVAALVDSLAEAARPVDQLGYRVCPGHCGQGIALAANVPASPGGRVRRVIRAGGKTGGSGRTGDDDLAAPHGSRAPQHRRAA
jgi:hypothetical protein